LKKQGKETTKYFLLKIKTIGGAVSIVIPHAFQVKQALEEKRIKVDFRKGENNEPDVIRIGPHFYTKDEEIEILFKEIDSIFASEEFLNYQDEIKYVI